MILTPAPDKPLWGVYNIQESENHIAYLGVYRVIYGWRVRAGWCDNPVCCQLDWCCGADWNDVEVLYSMLRSIMQSRPEEMAFEGLPRVSKVKPYYNDPNFCKLVGEAAGVIELIQLDCPLLVGD